MLLELDSDVSLTENSNNNDSETYEAIANEDGGVKITTTIFNLSSFVLNDEQVALLDKGMKFTPTPKNFDSIEFKADLINLTNKMRWKRVWQGKTTKASQNNSIVTRKSNKAPPKMYDMDAEALATQIECFKPQRNWSNTPNMPSDQYEALKMLISSDLCIKEADKGSGVVLMDLKFYQECIISMLNDRNTYEISDMDCGTLVKKVTKFVNTWSSVLNKEEILAVTKSEAYSATIYGLPKIHKSSIIQDTCLKTNARVVNVHNPVDLKFRPIVSCVNCPTTPLCIILNNILQPLLRKLKFCIKDTWDFLKRLPTHVDEDCFVMVADIRSLYTNITTDSGIAAITYYYDQFPETFQQRFTKRFVIELYVFCQENLFFSFDGTTYRQFTGTGMGRIYAPILANIKMAYDELKLEEFIRTNYSDMVANYFLSSYNRFLDDVAFRWRSSFPDMTPILIKMGQIDERIQYDFSSSLNEIPHNTIAFLDVLIIIKDGRLETDIYAKSTDTFNYLPFTSSHPRHVTRNIPYVLSKRIRGIVSNESTQTVRFNDMKARLRSKGYPIALINDGIKKALQLSRKDIISPKKPTHSIATNDNQPLHFVSTYNEVLKAPTRKVLNMISNYNARTTKSKNHWKVVPSYRQSPNLKSLLMHKKDKSKCSVNKCKKGCIFCNYLIEGNSVTLKTGHTLQPNATFECSSRNVVYIIVCGGCQEFYVGETGDMLKSRFTVHRQQSKLSAELTPVDADQHLRLCGKDKYGVFPFRRPKRNDIVLRRQLEKYWISTLKPKLNGLGVHT